MRKIRINYDTPNDHELVKWKKDVTTDFNQLKTPGPVAITPHKFMLGSFGETTAVVEEDFNEFLMEECPSAFIIQECEEKEAEWVIKPNPAVTNEYGYSHYIVGADDVDTREYEFTLKPLIIELFRLYEPVYFKVIER